MATINDSLQSAISSLDLGKAQEVKKSREELGQDDFLKLMITEIQNQDPFNPVENSDFVAQMAQFSSVTGIEKLQKSFGQLATSMTSNQALQASTLVGRSVLVASSEGFLGDTGGLSGMVNLENGSQDVVFHITDSSGQQIRSISMGPRAAGETGFVWDGFDADGTRLPAGRYAITAESKGFGETINLETYVNADVESVTLNRNTQGISLNLRDLGSVDFSKIKEIM